MHKSTEKSNMHIPVFHRLMVQFLCIVLLSLMIALLTNHLISQKFPEWIITTDSFQPYWQDLVNASFNNYQDYVNEHKLSCEDVIADTPRRFSEDKVAFYFEEFPFLDLNDPKQKKYIWDNNVLVLTCSDGYLVSSIYSPGSKLVNFYQICGITAGIISASLIFFPYILHLLHRIEKLYKQIQKSQNGEINNTIYLKGNDELSQLACNAEGMRTSLLRLVENEKKMQEEQTRLVSNLSHDIRTPLTKMIGYTELLMYQKNIDDSTHNKYVKSIWNTSQQMKK